MSVLDSARNSSWKRNRRESASVPETCCKSSTSAPRGVLTAIGRFAWVYFGMIVLSTDGVSFSSHSVTGRCPPRRWPRKCGDQSDSDVPKGTMQPSMGGNSGQDVFSRSPVQPWKEDFADVRANALNRLRDRSLVTPESGNTRRIFSLLLASKKWV